MLLLLQGSVFCELWSWLVFFAVMNSVVRILVCGVLHLNLNRIAGRHDPPLVPPRRGSPV